MSKLWTCPRGHPCPAPAAGGPLICPTCGAQVEPPRPGPPLPDGRGSAGRCGDQVEPPPELEAVTVPPDTQDEPPASPSPHTPDREPAPAAADAALPAQFGRYQVTAKLGSGGFGVVYKGFDPKLARPVAIKVPHRHCLATPADVEAYLTEGQNLALLDHSGIVGVLDVGQIDDGLCYLVSKFVAGSDLARRLKQARFSIDEAVEIVARVAEALHHAHGKGLVHRDIKPGNILLDENGNPVVADFGLALREEDVGTGPRLAGTPAYMSPEQARGEGHRVDARSDVYSLGVVFYELLTGRRPYLGKDMRVLVDQIVKQEPRPPRQLDNAIPRELDRICLKALAKRAVERYSTALDLAEDLRLWQAGQRRHSDEPSDDRRTALPSRPVQPDGSGEPSYGRRAPDSDRPIKIVPKGLRSFDAADADFFLELLPGPRDRDGLPDSIRFWKQRFEETDPDQTFSVGLLYGPSGCGKSSLVKAGLLPRLAKHVITVYVEASAEDTEAALLKGLRKRSPGLPAEATLPEAVARLRRGQGLPAGAKVVLVLDQFEQWLHAHREEIDPVLVRALRQCDGQHVQAVVLVRDDFWMAATRLLRALEVRLLEGHNSAAVDLFDLRHARKVLAAFGRAFGALPDGSLTAEQERFLDEAVAGLARDGKVISVRLALFADMVKGKPWTVATLKAVGGTEGIGATFLEETFSASTAPPEHRLHQQAARAVLKTLLPEAGTDIKGHQRSRRELLAASGYGTRPSEFDDLLGILDGELRLITPTEVDEKGRTALLSRPGGGDGSGEPSYSPEQYYQLTHDYLVPSLRTWLTRKQRETRRGRAELRLAERAAAWSAKPESRHLPAWWEWLNIHLCTRRRDWTQPQRKMMRKATRFHALRLGVLVLILGLLALGGVELHGRLQADHLVRTLATAQPVDVPKIIAELGPYRRLAEPLLVEKATADGDGKERVRACLALTAWTDQHVDYLAEQLLKAQPEDLPVLIGGLANYGPDLRERFWAVLNNDREDGSRRLRAAGALAVYDPDNADWDKVRGDMVRQLATEDLLSLQRWWAETMRPVQRRLTVPLVQQTANADVAGFPPRLLLLRAYKEETSPLLEQQLKQTLPETAAEENKETLAKQQARVAVALVQLGQADKVWPLLQHHGPDPRRRSYLLHWLAPLGVEPELLVRRLDEEADVTARRALLLSLGEFPDARWPASLRRDLTERLRKTYREDPDAGIHSAVDWLLRRWDQTKELQAIDAELKSKEPQGGRQWYVNSQGQTFTVVRGPVEVTMGSPPAQVGHSDAETLHQRRIPRSFAIATKKITLAQFLKSDKDHKNYGQDDGAGADQVSWFDAARYCNWLSEHEGLPKQEWCFEAVAAGQGDGAMKLAADYLHRKGYRLPTEAEWEYACRAGALSAYCFGETEELLDRYAWYGKNAAGRPHPLGLLKPNDLGLFDAHGNLWEWCLNRYQEYPKEVRHPIEDKEDKIDLEDINNNDGRVPRGGAFSDRAVDVRSANRIRSAPATRYDDVGFRPARTYP